MRRLLGLALLGLVALACSSTTKNEGATCVPGSQQDCSCDDGRMGSQECNADGTFDACSCTGGSAGAGGGSAGAGAMTGSGGVAGTMGSGGGAGTVGSGGGTGCPAITSPNANCDPCMLSTCMTEISACLMDRQCSCEPVVGFGSQANCMLNCLSFVPPDPNARENCSLQCFSVSYMNAPPAPRNLIECLAPMGMMGVPPPMPACPNCFGGPGP